MGLGRSGKTGSVFVSLVANPKKNTVKENHTYRRTRTPVNPNPTPHQSKKQRDMCFRLRMSGRQGLKLSEEGGAYYLTEVVVSRSNEVVTNRKFDLLKQYCWMMLVLHGLSRGRL